MNEVRKSIATASSFMSSADFDSWDGVCSGKESAFVECYRKLFNKQVSRKRRRSGEQSFGVGRSCVGVETGVDVECSSHSESPAASTVSVPPVASSFRHSYSSLLVLQLARSCLQFLASRVCQFACRNPFPKMLRTILCVTL